MSHEPELAEKVVLWRDAIDGDWQAIVAKAGGWFERAESEQAEQAKVMRYEESASACCLVASPWPAAEPPPNAWHGRIFTEASELRWRRYGSMFRAWLVGEREHEGATRADVMRLRRRHYLLGQVDRVDGAVAEASEPRYPGVVFRYPVSGAEVAKGAKAYISVAIYLPAMPRWEALQEVTAVSDALDSPWVCEHRFESVAFGYNEKRGD